VEGYFPGSHWYDYYTGLLIVKESDNGKTVVLNAPIDYIPLHIRGGYIMPTQEPANTTYFSREKPFGLIVAPDMNGEAKGDLFYDDGETDLDKNQYFHATFSLRESILKMNVEKNNYAGMQNRVLDTIRVFVPNPKVKLNFIINGNTNNYTIISGENIKYDGKIKKTFI
jgi:maltase-glucoamylase